MFTDLQDFLKLLRKEREIIDVTETVDPYLEAAEIHRRVIEEGGPALFFRSIKGSPFPLVTNLFGTTRRIELAFGKRPEELVRKIAELPHTLLPPTIGKLWRERSLFRSLLKVGLKRSSSSPLLECVETPPRLTSLPLLTTWQEDGGPFITLPLVYTEHPTLGVSNLGMYRLQRFNDHETGFHCQIGKGAGFHLAEARTLKKNLPVTVHIGGPPALILSAIAPLPENVPELLLASLVYGKKLPLLEHKYSALPCVSSAEFVLVGEVDPNETRPEGPFGDHYGYYSLKHDYPVFKVKSVLRKKSPVCTATVVGKPRQEDFYLGDYLQELLSPLFPVVMPAVKDLWSYGETGYHSLTAAVVRERYKRESMASAFRILGEGQLSLTKFLIVMNDSVDLKKFPAVLEHVLARADFRTDLFVFSNLSMDTLDYTGPKVNEGSKGVLLGVGDPIRELPRFFNGSTPPKVSTVMPFCKGCLVIGGPAFSDDPKFGHAIVQHPDFKDWPLIILVDNVHKTIQTPQSFLWTTFTRFEPGADIISKNAEIVRNHIAYNPPILIDARMKPHYPKELECDSATRELVDSRWNSYFIE